MGVEAVKTDEQVIMGAVMRRVVVDQFLPYLSKRSDNPLCDFIRMEDLDTIINDYERAVRLVLGKYAQGSIGTFDFRSIMEPAVAELAAKYLKILPVKHAFVEYVNSIAEDVRGFLRGTVDRESVDPTVLNLIDLARGRVERLRSTDGGDVVLGRDMDKVLIDDLALPNLDTNVGMASVVDSNSDPAVTNEDFDRVVRSFGDPKVSFNLVNGNGGNIFDSLNLKELFEAYASGKLSPLEMEIMGVFTRNPSIVSITYKDLCERLGRSYVSIQAAFSALRGRGIVIKNYSFVKAPGFYLLQSAAHNGTRADKFTPVYAEPDFA